MLSRRPRSRPPSSAAGSSKRRSAGGLAWVNECLAAGLPCAGAIAVWVDPYFIVLEFDRDVAGGPPTTTLATARSIVDTVVLGLPD